MGFYHGSTRRGLSSEDVGPTITPREYTILFAGAMQMVICRSLHQSDSMTHRMLAIAEAHAGNSTRAVRHLEIAVNMLVARAAKGGIHESLCARVELARLLPILVPLCLRCGRSQVVRRLLDELLLGVAGG